MALYNTHSEAAACSTKYTARCIRYAVHSTNNSKSCYTHHSSRALPGKLSDHFLDRLPCGAFLRTSTGFIIKAPCIIASARSPGFDRSGRHLNRENAMRDKTFCNPFFYFILGSQQIFLEYNKFRLSPPSRGRNWHVERDQKFHTC